jgi:hypothetical protein
MTTSRIKEKISTLVQSQLPEFVRSDYSTFVSFLEAYYEFLEQDQSSQELIQNALSYSDIDKTASSFVQYFLKNYANSISPSSLANKPLLIKRINDLYTSKGGEMSFKLLFNILYDTSVALNYPYEYVLRASDGVWEQRVSIRVTLVDGSASDILNRYLILEKNGIVYKTNIIRLKDLGNNLYELFLDSNTLGAYAVDDIVSVSDNEGVIFVGTVAPTTTGYSVIAAGKNFKVGQIFTLNVAGAVDTIIQVTGVDSSGGITNIKFINFGYGFTSSVTANFDANLPVATTVQAKASRTLGFIEGITIFKNYSASDSNRYFDTDYTVASQLYTGNLTHNLSTTVSYSEGSSSGSQTDDRIATIIFTLGAVGRYPGAYTSNKGFLSEAEVKLQDNLLYQPFAYQTVTDLDISKFYDAVKFLVHPAGQQLYNNRTITNEINVAANVSVVYSVTAP